MSENRRKKTRVLFLVPSLRRAGAETQVVELVNSLDRRKFDVYLFTFEKNLDQYLRIHHERIAFFNKPRKYKLDFSILNRIADVIVREKIDIVHCTLQISLFMGCLAVVLSRKRPRPKLIAAIHTTINKSLKETLFDRMLYQWFLRACKRVIFVSHSQKEYWVAGYPFLYDKSVVIHNGVDTSYFNPSQFREDGKELRRSLGIPDDASVVSCLAGFRKEKAHHILVKAFGEVELNSYLLLAGDGETRTQIEILVQRMELTNRVKFLGEVQDVRPVLAASDVSVLASISVETFSIAMLESMSMSVPVVATHIGGLSEAVVSGKTGELVRPGSPKMLRTAIEQILNNVARHEKMKIRSRQIVIERFSKENMVSNTESFFTQISE